MDEFNKWVNVPKNLHDNVVVLYGVQTVPTVPYDPPTISYNWYPSGNPIDLTCPKCNGIFKADESNIIGSNGSKDLTCPYCKSKIKITLEAE